MPHASATIDPTQRPMAVQIGFNKCATLSLTRLFNRSGVNSVHCNWSKGHPNSKKPHYQGKIHRNLQTGRPAFDGFARFSAFFDLELIRSKRHFENFKQFATIAQTYPNAKFILNLRHKEDWVRSRTRHSNGKYLNKYKQNYNETEAEVLARWAQDFDHHHTQVRRYFQSQPHRLVEFHINTDPIEKLVDFFADSLPLDPLHWGHAHKTDDKKWAQAGQGKA